MRINSLLHLVFLRSFGSMATLSVQSIVTEGVSSEDFNRSKNWTMLVSVHGIVYYSVRAL